jgi:hypothetical protein
MNKILNQELLAETIRRLEYALKVARRGEDPQLLLASTLGPLQLHCQRQALERAKLEDSPNRLGYSPEQLDDAIKLIDSWIQRLKSNDALEANDADDTLCMHYSPLNLLMKLQSLETKKKLRED